MFAPAGIPKAVEEKLSSALKTVLADNEVATQMERGGTIAALAGARRSRGEMDKDEVRWADVIKQAGIKAE